jgi:hypothetical protein
MSTNSIKLWLSMNKFREICIKKNWSFYIEIIHFNKRDYVKWVLIRPWNLRNYKYVSYYYLLISKMYWYKILFLKCVGIFKILLKLFFFILLCMCNSSKTELCKLTYNYVKKFYYGQYFLVLFQKCVLYILF